MAVEDYLEPEVAVTAAVVAAIFSPRVRKLLRRGAVYGLAGVLAAGDTAVSLSQRVGHGVQTMSASATNATHNAVEQTRAKATTAETPDATTISAKKAPHSNTVVQEKYAKEGQA